MSGEILIYEVWIPKFGQSPFAESFRDTLDTIFFPICYYVPPFNMK